MENKQMGSCHSPQAFYAEAEIVESASKYAVAGAVVIIVSVLAVSLLTPINMFSSLKAFLPYLILMAITWGSIAVTKKYCQ